MQFYILIKVKVECVYVIYQNDMFRLRMLYYQKNKLERSNFFIFDQNIPFSRISLMWHPPIIKDLNAYLMVRDGTVSFNLWPPIIIFAKITSRRSYKTTEATYTMISGFTWPQMTWNNLSSLWLIIRVILELEKWPQSDLESYYLHYVQA